MKSPVKKIPPTGFVDYVSLGLTTFGVGYIPGAPGTYGSAIAVGAYLGITNAEAGMAALQRSGLIVALNSVLLGAFILLGVWASGRAIPLLGDEDPSTAVVDEVMGQLLTFCFVPIGIGWPYVLAGFGLFRLFDIWKPYPIRAMEVLPSGLGICADDLAAGVYAGICLALSFAIFGNI